METCPDSSGGPQESVKAPASVSIDRIAKRDYTLRGVSEILYNSLLRRIWGKIVSRIVFGTYGPEACVNWGSEIGMPCLVSCFSSRSASVSVKSGIKTWTMLSSLVLALVFVSGCNSEDTTSETKAPATGGAAAPAKPGGMDKPGGGDMAKPPAPSKPDESKKP